MRQVKRQSLVSDMEHQLVTVLRGKHGTFTYRVYNLLSRVFFLIPMCFWFFGVCIFTLQTFKCF